MKNFKKRKGKGKRRLKNKNKNNTVPYKHLGHPIA